MKTKYTAITKRGIQTKWVKHDSTVRYDPSTRKRYDTLCIFVTVYGTSKIQVWQEPDHSWSFKAGVKHSKVGQFQTAKAAKRAAKKVIYLSIWGNIFLKMTKHYLIRPPEDATEVHRWTGIEWIPDDGKPGIAFSGKGRGRIPYAFHPYCDCHTFDDRCPMNGVCSYTFQRYGCSNSYPVKSQKMIKEELQKKRTAERKVKQKIAKEKLDNRRKVRLEKWLKEIGIVVTLDLTNGKVAVPLKVMEKLQFHFSYKF